MPAPARPPRALRAFSPPHWTSAPHLRHRSCRSAMTSPPCRGKLCCHRIWTSSAADRLDKSSATHMHLVAVLLATDMATSTACCHSRKHMACKPD